MTTAEPPLLDDPFADGLLRTVGWIPTTSQADLLNHMTRFTLLAGGERWGKSDLAAHYGGVKVMEYVLTEVAEGRDPGGDEMWLVAADYARTKAEFDYMANFFGRLGLLKFATTAVDPGRIEVNTGVKGGQPFYIRTKTANDYRTLAMTAPIGIVVCEASQIDYEAYMRLQGRVAEKRGWLFLEGTFESSLGWYASLWKEWQPEHIWATEDSRSWSMASHLNSVVYPGGAEDPEILRLQGQMTEDHFAERHLGIPAPPHGLVHPGFSVPTHVQRVEYVPGEAVYLAIDPGISAATQSAYAIGASHIVDGQIRVFDEIYKQEIYEEDILRDILMKKVWFSDVKFAVIDRAGAQRAGAHPPSVEVWRKVAGISPMFREKIIEIPAGIRRFDSFLAIDSIKRVPGLVIDSGCTGLLSELGGAENPFTKQTQVYSWNLTQAGDRVGDRPRDRFNHHIKALVYLMVHQFGFATAGTSRRKIRVSTRNRRRRNRERIAV